MSFKERSAKSASFGSVSWNSGGVRAGLLKPA